MSFLSILKDVGHTFETVGSDIEKGLAIAAPLVTAIPGIGTLVGPILTEVEQLILQLTQAGQTLTAAQISAIVQTVAASQSVKQATAAATPTT